MNRLLSLFLLFMVALAACQSATETPLPVPTTATEDLRALANAITPIATANPIASPTLTTVPSKTSTPTLTPIPSLTPTLSATPSPTFTPTLTPIPTDTLTPSITPTLAPTVHFLLGRPIPEGQGRIDYLDRTYPYGSTQLGNREPHLGVEFVNGRFTPVQAVADATVFFASSDDQIQVGPYLNYYGNVIILDHGPISPEGRSVYSLYGHLQRINVEKGDTVAKGDEIGLIGDSGVALGPHLHFEVRLDEPLNYLATRNPDLWIKPYFEYGLLAGRLTDPEGALLEQVIIKVRNKSGFSRETYTYDFSRANSDDLWDESFTLGDLPIGEYEAIISTRYGKLLFQEDFTIWDGDLTWLNIVIPEHPDERVSGES